MHEEINPFDVVSGKVTYSEHGTFWFKEPGNNMAFEGLSFLSQLHREDGPAYISKYGDKWWYNNGKKHRVGGPAVTSLDGYEEWWVDGERHREDGPALILADGEEIWYIHGTRRPRWIMLLKNYLRKIKRIKK